MFDKIYNFYIDNEKIIKENLLLLFFLILTLLVIGYFCKQLIIDKNIIENTKNYVIYDNCKKFNNKFYCWEEVDD